MTHLAMAQLKPRNHKCGRWPSLSLSVDIITKSAVIIGKEAAVVG